MSALQREASEEDVIKAIRDYLGYHGVILHRVKEPIPFKRDRFDRPKRTSTVGFPDLVGYIKGGKLGLPKYARPVPLYIEVKRPGGRRRLAQKLFIAGLKQDNVTAFFAESVEDAVAELTKAGFIVR